MSAEIVKRSEIAKPIFNPKLARDSKLNLADNIRIYTPWWLALTSLASVIIAITAGVTLAWLFGLVFGLIALATGLWSICWGMSIADRNSWDFAKRREYVFLDRYRTRRYHRELEKTRLRHLDNDYDRFSVRVKRSGGSGVEVVVLRHQYNDNRFNLFIPWLTAESKLGYGAKGWDKYGIESKEILNPTVDEVQSLYDKMQELAKDLEEQSYQQALEQYKANAIVAAVNIPGTEANEFVKSRIAAHTKEDTT